LFQDAARFVFKDVPHVAERVDATAGHERVKGSRQRGVDVARSQIVYTARVQEGCRQRCPVWQLPFNAYARLNRVWRSQVTGHSIGILGPGEWRETLDRGHIREGSKHVPISNRKLLLVHPVETRGLQGQIFSSSFVEDARSAANNCLCLSPRGSSRGPRERDARREVQVAADIRLCFITQAVAERETRMYSPVILEKSTDVPLLDPRRRIAAGQRELRRLPAERSNLGRTQSLSLKQQSASIP